MIRELLKMVAYSKAPRTTFSVRHPGTALRLRKMQWDLRHAPAPRVAAVGALAVALPIGFLAGKMSSGGQNGGETSETSSTKRTAGANTGRGRTTKTSTTKSRSRSADATA